jgi:hypothetical protein
VDIQKACEILEELSEADATAKVPKLTMKEFMALQLVLLELQSNGSYKLTDK